MDEQSPHLNDLHQGPDEVHLQDYLNVLFRHRRAALAIFLLVVVLVAGWTLWTKPVYEATTTLHVKDEKVKGGDFLSDLGLRRENPIETEIEILKSRTNAEETVRRLHLNWRIDKKSPGVQVRILEFKSSAEVPVYTLTLTAAGAYQVQDADGKSVGEAEVGKRFQGSDLTLLVDDFQGQPGDHFRLGLRPFNGTVAGLRGGVRASELGKGTNIIRLSYQDTDPALSREVVNTLAAVYLERSVGEKAEEARKSVTFIQTQLDEVRELLDQAEKRLETYKSASGVVNLDAEAQALIARISDAEKAKSEAELRQRQAEFAMEALQQALTQHASYAPGALLDDPVISTLANQLASLEVQRQGLLVEYGEAHPKMVALRDSIEGVQQKLLASYAAMRAALISQVSDLKAQLAGFEKQLKKLPAAEQQLARLTRLATVNADIYTFLLQKHEEARIAKAATISNVSVIDPAITPEIPVKPNKRKNLLLALVVGAMLGVGLAFFLEYLDDTIKDADSAKRLLGLPVLAVIPHIGRLGKEEAVAEAEVKRTLISHLEPKSAPAEAFRALRTALHFSARDEKKVILVTSAFPGEGKTTVSANIAETFSQTGSRVLLIGCDLRRPTLHHIFDRPKTPGITEYLVGDCTFEQIIHKTGIKSLDFISAGTTPPNPAEILGSDAMEKVLEAFRDQYDTIVLDAPPMLAVTDASLLTTFSDQVLVVLEAGGVRIKAARRLAELLQAARASVVGIALNDKTGRGAEYYSYYRDRYGKYGYAYGYYSSGDDEEPTRRRSLIARIFKR